MVQVTLFSVGVLDNNKIKLWFSLAYEINIRKLFVFTVDYL